MKTFTQFIVEAKRLKFVKMYHGTSASSADKIKKSGFNTPEVYTSTSKETAKSFGNRKGEDTKVVSFRVPKKHIEDKPPGKVVKTDGQRGTDKWGRQHYSTTMSSDYANKHISKEKQGVIDSPKIPKKYQSLLPANSRFKRRTQTQPKKNPSVSEAKEARPPKEVLAKIAKAYTDTHIRHPQVRESIKLLDDAWIPPASKRLRGGTESPLSAARKKGTDVNKVRASVNRFAEPINNPRHPDIDYKKDDKTGTHTFTHKKHPIQVKYSAGDKPGTFIQNTTKTGETTDKVGAARAMQDIKKRVSSSARPGTTLVSQPVGNRRASLNTRTQGMSDPDPEHGVQAGIARNRSPKQKARGAKPLDPVKHTGTFIDPNH